MVDVTVFYTDLELKFIRNITHLLRVLECIPSHNKILENLFGIL
jgi:hypothetical protein